MLIPVTGAASPVALLLVVVAAALLGDTLGEGEKNCEAAEAVEAAEDAPEDAEEEDSSTGEAKGNDVATNAGLEGISNERAVGVAWVGETTPPPPPEDCMWKDAGSGTDWCADGSAFEGLLSALAKGCSCCC